MKKMIVIKGAQNSGKARSIKKVYRIFSALKELDGSLDIELSEPVMINEFDFQATLVYRGKKIGILSLNEHGLNHRKWLKELADGDCEIIVCASRQREETLDNVNDIAEEYEYDTVCNVVSLITFDREKDERLYEVWSRRIAEGIIGLIDGLINREHDLQHLQSGIC
jgi:hypothetical protein